MANTLPRDSHGFVVSRDVLAAGRRAELQAAVAAGELAKVRRGIYREPGDGRASQRERAESAYRDAVLALALMRQGVIFTGYSAAVLLGLPIVGAWPREIHVMSRDRHGNRRGNVVATASTREYETSVQSGCLITAVEFTLVQLCRRAPLIDALAAMDAAVHMPRVGDRRSITTIERIRGEHERLLPYPGSARTAAVLSRTTTDSESPLETGSRVVIEEFGFPAPELQHEFWLPELGRRAFLDFYWPEFNVGAEADGRGKYRNGLLPTVTTPEELDRLAATITRSLMREKDRAEALRRQVAGLDGWNWADLHAKQPIRARLSALGVPVVRRPRTLWMPAPVA